MLNALHRIVDGIPAGGVFAEDRGGDTGDDMVIPFGLDVV